MIKFEQIVKQFNIGTPDQTTLFDHFNLEIERGEFVSIVGSNGSGKTTLLNMLCGTLPIEGGRILLNDMDISRMSEYRRAAFIGRVFQDPAKGSCPDLTIIENMALADNKKKGYGLGRGVNKRRLDYYRSLLETCHMGLENRMQVPVGSLSGGQRQALALLLANMSDIDILILDEHTAALDPKSSRRIMEITQEMVEKTNITTLMVTHNLRFALEYGDRLLMMHEGRSVKDIKGQEKKDASIDDLLKIFNEISIECGN